MTINIYDKLMIFTIILLTLLILIYFYNIYYSKEYYQWNNCKLLDQEKLVNTFERNGVIIIPNFFSSEDCDKLKDIIKKKENNYYDVNPKYETSTNINSPYKRRNMALPIKECRKYILSICNKMKYFINILTPNPILVDCAAFVTEPGCYPQKWHKDTNLDSINYAKNQKYANHISFGVMLEDTDETLGPLEAILGTNNLFFNKLRYILEKNNLINDYDSDFLDKKSVFRHDDIKRGLCKNSIAELPKLDNKFQQVKCICPKGSIVLWSSRVFHRGGQNYGNKDRPVFYITLMGNDGENPMNFKSTIEISNKKIYVKDLL